MKYKNLLSVCNTEKQKELVHAVIDHNSIKNAAEHLNVATGTVSKTLTRLKRKAESLGKSDHYLQDINIHEGLPVNGTSTMIKTEDGIQWIKTKASDMARQQLLEDVVDAFKEEIPVYTPTKNKKKYDGSLLNAYVLTDYHLGMIAFEEQTGDEDWDTKKATDVLIKWFKKAIESSPEASECVFMQLGDFFHIDNETGTTPRSGHVLAKDLSPRVLYRVVMTVTIKIIGMLEQKYKKVNVMFVAGNHDPVLSGALLESLNIHYSDCKNINLNQDHDYHCLEFGDVTLFSHHGHLKKIGVVSEVFVSKFRKEFGRTKYSYAHLGHYHHNHLKENNMMSVEQHRTLAPKDDHSSSGGYHSGRDAKVITYHKDFGEVSRIIINRDMIK